MRARNAQEQVSSIAVVSDRDRQGDQDGAGAQRGQSFLSGRGPGWGACAASLTLGIEVLPIIAWLCCFSKVCLLAALLEAAMFRSGSVAGERKQIARGGFPSPSGGRPMRMCMSGDLGDQRLTCHSFTILVPAMMRRWLSGDQARTRIPSLSWG
jgi:hypothetical protein